MAGLSELSLVKNKLEDYKCDANEALFFKLVRNEEDLYSNDVFHPDMSHQIFGEQNIGGKGTFALYHFLHLRKPRILREMIFGYKDLQVQMYYSAAKLNTYMGMTYTDKVTPEKDDGLTADNVLDTLSKQIPPGFYSNMDDFSAALAKDTTFRPFGELLHTYTITKDSEERHFEIYKTDIDCPGFREYHERLQTFILFYIDAASYIDVDDDRWKFYLLFEKYRADGNTMYAIAGYMTVYSYYAYPSRERPRISQVLILPPFQKQGHGVQLLQTFYNCCYGNSDICDITVEDPSENFQRLRDFVDARNCIKLKSFQPDKLVQGFDDDMLHDAKVKLKLNKKQTRRVYEILRLKVTDRSNPEEYRQYRLDVKRRLNVPFQKNGRDFEKLQKALKPDELSATLSCMSLEQRHQYLEKAYQEHLEMYEHVIERLNRD